MAVKKTVPKVVLRRLTQVELDAFLDKAADILRGNVDHSEFRGYVFALLFFKRISDVYQEEIHTLAERLGDEKLAKDPKMHNFIVPEGGLWRDVARKSRNELGTALNEAMIAIERANQPKFDGILTNKIDFNKSDELPREKLINLINHFSQQAFDRTHVSDDIFGNAYEHLIRNFASKAGKSSGEFYTPAEVAYVMADIIEPKPDHSVCDWAAGSGGLLLQCRNYVKRQGEDPDRLMLYAQESNVTTYNICRINMILHGVKSWTHRQGDSIRNPKLLDDKNQLLEFDRIVMNPPFSLEDWGYQDFVGGDPHHRFEFGLPPRDNGDYAWLQQVVKSLKPDGKAIIVMSQGVLFRGQPEQTEAEDGRSQKAHTEYVIREGFVKADLIECIVVLPPKLFYGNNVPGCLIVLSKQKSASRKGKILMIWASRNFQKANPQNVLRPSDLLRVLVPWHAFGDLDVGKSLIPAHEAQFIAKEEAQRKRQMKDIESAYGPLLEPLQAMKRELIKLEAEEHGQWSVGQDNGPSSFGSLPLPHDNEMGLRTSVNSPKRAHKHRVKELKAKIRELEKLQTERDKKEARVHETFEREITLIRAAANDLVRIFADPEEAARYFSVAEMSDVVREEFNLNLPRYVDTFDPKPKVVLEEAATAYATIVAEKADLQVSVQRVIDEVLQADIK